MKRRNKLILLIIILFFSNYNKNRIIIKHNTFITKKNPKISVIIPIFNGGKYLNYSLRSVQRQKMKDIEIIIVDDNSNDNSLEIIKNYMKKDNRIRLIENKINRKILFCKSIGALNSRGKYIIELDQDDMFVNDDAFNILYNESEKSGLDLLGFKYIFRLSNLKQKANNNSNNDIIIEQQPKLKNTMFRKRLYLLWGSLIETNLYKKIIYNLWQIIINYKIVFQEDFLITFFILIYAKKYKYIKNILLYHFVNKKSSSKGFLNNTEFYLSVLFVGNIYYDYYFDFNSQDFNLIMNYINFHAGFIQKTKILYPSFFEYFLGKIVSNDNLSSQNKQKLRKKFNLSEKYDSYEYFNISNNNILNKYYCEKHIVHQQNYELSMIILLTKYNNFINLLKSIFAQNYDFFEIILIYDETNETEFNLIENCTKTYKNIKLINNKIKKGSLFSILKGIFISKGQYFMVLEENCFFLNDDSIKNIYEVIIKEDLDVIEFNLYKLLKNKDDIYIQLYKCEHFLSIFNFTEIKFNLNFREIDIQKELLTNKIIKSSFFKNITKFHKLDKIKEIIDNYYNEIINFIIESIPHKYNYTRSINIYKNNTDFDKIIFNDFIKEKEKYVRETIFYLNFLYDISEDTFEFKEKILNEFFNVMNIIFNKFTKISEESFNLINKFLNCKYISSKNKMMLKFYYNSLIN